jgi:DNA-binding NarL/FixJ family response regulator
MINELADAAGLAEHARGGPRKIRVTVCVEHPLVSAGLRAALQDHRDIEVVGCAQRHFDVNDPGGARAVDVAVAEAAPALLSQLRAPSGRSHLPSGRRVVAVGGGSFAPTVLDVVRSGVRGFVSERSVSRELPEAVRAVAQGRAFLSPDWTAELLEWLANRLPEDAAELARASDVLTCREQQVLKLLGGGYSNIEISRALVISDTTVRSHVYHILAKLDLQSRTHAVLFGYRFQLAVRDDCE